MKRKRIFIIIFSFLAAVIFGALLWPREREPRYHGQSLTFWLSSLDEPEKENEAVVAIRDMDTNAVPWLTRWLAYEPSRWKLKMIAASRRLPENAQDAFLSAVMGDRFWDKRKLLTLAGFEVLGPQARSAVTEIVKIMTRRTSKRSDAWPFSEALEYIGEDSLPPLVAIVTNRTYSKELRAKAIYWIGLVRVLNGPTVSNLVQCIQSDEREVGLEAAVWLAGSRLEPDVVLPFLTNQVHDTNADTRYRIIESIHDYGKRGLPALPTLVDSLQDPSESVRDAATNAIFEIAQDVLPAGARPRTRYTDIAIPKPRHPR